MLIKCNFKLPLVFTLFLKDTVFTFIHKKEILNTNVYFLQFFMEELLQQTIILHGAVASIFSNKATFIELKDSLRINTVLR